MSERSRHSERFDRDGYRHLEVVPDEEIGVFRPRERVMGMVAASAAAEDLLRRIGDQIGAGDRPEPPIRDPKDDEEITEPFAKAA